MEETNYLQISGMHCAACAVRIEKSVSRIEGVSTVSVSLATEKGRVTFNKEKTQLSDIIQKIQKIGFGAKEIPDTSQLSEDRHNEMKDLQWKFFISSLLTFPLAWAMVAHFKWFSFIYVPELFLNPWFQLALTIPIQFLIGLPFYEGAWNALKNKSANMDVLVVLSTSAAFFYSHYLTFESLHSQNQTHPIGLFYETSAFIVTFILLGKLLEAKTKLKTTEAIQKLYQLQTKTAILYQNGKEIEISVGEVSPGDIIVVKPWGKVPLDGQVIHGYSMIDESMLTGESVPVEKQTGHFVYAGTVNQDGKLTFKVTKKDSETTLSQIIRIVEEAQASKAPMQYIADKVTEVFVPIVIFIALVTFTAWYFLFQPGDFYEALEKLITVLIIACPCALGLATPTSVMVGSGRAAQKGILFKEGKYLELLGKNTMVAIDKTGTLTKGEPIVTDLYVEKNYSENAFLELVGAVESASDHPVGKAINKMVNEKLLYLPNAAQVSSMPGYGVKGFIHGKKVVIANPRYFLKNNESIPAHAAKKVSEFEQQGKTVMLAFIDSRFSGIIAVADEIKTTSKDAVCRLKQMGIDVIMLTGDNQTIAMTVAESIGIKRYRAEILPQEKAEIIQELQKEGHKVIMVGDGINDAPALTVADVGIAIGTGSDVAIESGDITIMTGDINRVVDAMMISKKTITNIKQNFLWAFLYNIIMVPLAMLGMLAPWIAGLAMAFSSVSVVLNSLRLKRVKIH
ncbi:heavy metal translocating P-type ATPase [Peribacillus alkalitolerans]|uniref:heavy metal translocating P-type ATPase n=1 Tax=Peribacillus alkalitolerans TaxID=1550385 RepID=UPI0013D2B3C5|nr:heavy metal translocating P-type ATPase [Peribacillus alkalitolerans]